MFVYVQTVAAATEADGYRESGDPSTASSGKSNCSSFHAPRVNLSLLASVFPFLHPDTKTTPHSYASSPWPRLRRRRRWSALYGCPPCRTWWLLLARDRAPLPPPLWSRCVLRTCSATQPPDEAKRDDFSHEADAGVQRPN